MTFPNISKKTAMFIAFAIIALYLSLFLGFYRDQFGHSPPVNFAFWMVIAGTTMTQIIVVPPGEIVYITFFGRRTEVIWGGGIYFLPNIFQFTTFHFHFSVLWGVERIGNLNEKINHHELNHVYLDSRDVHRSLRADVTLTQMTVIQFLAWFFFGWKKTAPHLIVSNFGFRVMTLGLVILFATGAVTKVSTAVSETVTSVQQDASKKIDNTIRDGIKSFRQFAESLPPP